MSDQTPFDMGPDRELGARLREALSAGDDPAFAARVRARLGTPAAWWEVLGARAHPALAAAAVLVALGGLWLGMAANGPSPLADELAVVATPGSVTDLLAGNVPPAVDVVLAVSEPY